MFKIGGYLKFSLIDFPKHIAAVIFTQGCNFRCPFCHNPELVLKRRFQLPIPQREIWEFLQKRQGKLDGVAITGGEPLIQPGLDEFIRKIKKMGYAVKLDTNGTSPGLLNRLIRENLIDYIAMDLKADENNYAKVCGVPVNFDKIVKSMDIIRSSGLHYEFRTTVVKPLHQIDNFEQIAGLLQTEDKYILQNYRESKRVGSKDLDMQPFSDAELQQILSIFTSHSITAKIR